MQHIPNLESTLCTDTKHIPRLQWLEIQILSCTLPSLLSCRQNLSTFLRLGATIEMGGFLNAVCIMFRLVASLFWSHYAVRSYHSFHQGEEIVLYNRAFVILIVLLV